MTVCPNCHSPNIIQRTLSAWTAIVDVERGYLLEVKRD